MNRPYVFELAHQFLAAQRSGVELAGHYTNALVGGVDRAQLDRAVATLRRIDPPDVDAWIRWEYVVDGWLRGYLDAAADPHDPALTVWVLSQLADAHYRSTP